MEIRTDSIASAWRQTYTTYESKGLIRDETYFGQVMSCTIWVIEIAWNSLENFLPILIPILILILIKLRGKKNKSSSLFI